MINSVAISILPLLVFAVLSFCGPQAVAKTETGAKCEMQLITEKSLCKLCKGDAVTTMHYGEDLPGEHGGTYGTLEIEASAETGWNSRVAIIPSAPHGDPRQGASLLGAIVSYFLGLREINPYKITIPDVAEINAAIQKLNEALKELGYPLIPIQFYETVNVSTHSLDFLKKFTKDLLLPFAKAGDLRIHDVSYHLATLGLPAEILMPVIERYKIALEFYQFASERESSSDAKVLLENFLDVLVGGVDMGLGNITTAYIVYLREINKPNVSKARKEVLEKMRFNMLETTWQVFDSRYGTTRSFINDYIHIAFNKQRDPDAKLKLNVQAEAFFAELQARGIDIDKVFTFTGPEIHAKIVKRRIQLEQAVELIRKGKKS